MDDEESVDGERRMIRGAESLTLREEMVLRVDELGVEGVMRASTFVTGGGDEQRR